MTLLIEMQKTLVTFSLTLMLTYTPFPSSLTGEKGLTILEKYSLGRIRNFYFGGRGGYILK